MSSNTLMAEYPVSVTHLDKVLWPEQGITKAEYIHYMIAMSEVMVRHYQQRLLTVVRYPHGIHQQSFYQKNIPAGAPEWMETYPVWSDDSKREIHYILANNKATMIWLANQAAMELHLSFSKIDNLDRPTNIAFDLDPTVQSVDRAGFRKASRAALLLKEALDDLRLPSYPKTSGATGLQVFVPIASGYSFADTRQITQFLGQYLTKKAPDLITVERLKKDRGDKVYFDFLQHHRSKTLAGPYTPRAVPSAAVSAPLAWEEVEEGVLPELFTIRTMPKRVEKHGDLFAPMCSPGVEIGEIINFIRNHPLG